MPSEKSLAFFEALARYVEPGDFWRQVGRTVDGVAVDEAQVAMAVDAIRDGLSLGAHDVVLDLACGNGALSRRVLDRCAAGLGVDFSEGMIVTARAHFADSPRVTFLQSDVEAFVSSCPDPERFTKGFCFFSFQYLGSEAGEAVLRGLHSRFTSMATFFVGDMPDKARMSNFSLPGDYRPGLEDEYESPYGVWRTPAEFVGLASLCGWEAETRMMPAEYYAAEYRFNAVLRRR